jgi:hypothetical protein
MASTLALCCKAGAQDARFVGKAPAPSEVTTRIDNSPPPGVLRDAQGTRGVHSPKEIDQQIRDMVENKLRGPGGTRGIDGGSKPKITIGNEVQAHKIGQKWFANYKLYVEDIPLSDASQISTIAVEDGSAAVVKERNLPRSLNFDARRQGTSQAKVPLEAAATAARTEIARLATLQKAVGVDADALKIDSNRLEVWVEPKNAIGKLVWAIRLVPEQGKAATAGFDVWVDALGNGASPEVFEVKALTFNEHAGSVTAMVWDPTALDPLQQHPLASVEVLREGPVMAEREDTAFTDSTGQFHFDGGNGERRFSVRLANKYFVVRNAQGALVQVNAAGRDGQPIKLEFTSTREFDIAQPSGFYWANRARAFVSEALADDKLLKVNLVVNWNDDCNSFWSTHDNQISLFKASTPASGRACPNRAVLHTVFHEFGHAVDHAFGGIQNSEAGAAYSEGFGDSLAILFTDQSCYGVNSNGPHTCLRNAATPPVMYPCETCEIHERGRVFSGFTWELIQKLTTKYPRPEALAIAKRLTLQAAAANPLEVKDAVELTLLADDDDIDLSNGTPNSKLIAAAAKARKIPLPDALPPQ